MITISKTEINLDRSEFKVYCTTNNTTTISKIYVDVLSNRSNILSIDDENHSFVFSTSDVTVTTIDSTNFYFTITTTNLNCTDINQLYIVGLRLSDSTLVSTIVTDLYELYPLKVSITRNAALESGLKVSMRRYTNLILKENLFSSAKINNDLNTALNIYTEILKV